MKKYARIVDWMKLLKSRDLQPLLWILVIGFAMRLGWNLAFPVIDVISDSLRYHWRAHDILYRAYYGGARPKAFEPPLFPVLIALIYGIIGEHWRLISLTHNFLALATIALGFFTISRQFDRQVALVASALLAVNIQWIAMNNLILSETLYTFFLLAFVWAFFALAGRNVWLALLTGVIGGLATLTREVILLFPLFLLVIQLVARRPIFGVTSRNLAFIVLGVFLTVAPWTIRNMIRFDTFVPVTTKTGEILYYGNRPGAIGWTADHPYVGLPPIETGRALMRAAILFIVEEPLLFIRRAVQKIALLFSFRAYGIQWSEWMTPLSELKHGRAYAWLSLAHYAVIFFGALAGLVFVRRQWTQPFVAFSIALFVYCMALHGIFLGSPRFRHALEFFLAVFAAIAICHVGDILQRRRGRSTKSPINELCED